MKHVKSFSDDQLKTEFDKIRTVAAELQSQNIRRSLKRPGADLEQNSSKKSKSTEAPKSDVHADSQQPSVEVPSQKATIEDVEVPSNTASTTQHTDGDPEAEHKMCLKYASDADSASNDETPVNLHAVTVGGLVVHIFVDKKYPLSVNLIERMLDHQLEIYQETVGNELTTAVQLIAFLKKQIDDSRHPKVHDWYC
ncbi:hypothetical protein Tco_1557991 [Tanacetum coccineum]